MGKYRKAGCLILALLLTIGSVLSGCGKDEMAAKTMRLLKVEGDVKLEVDGEIIEFTENQRLVDGNALRTAVASLASVGLDDTKIVTMNESSRAEFHKDGKDIALTVTEGTAFFEVNKTLDASETMTVGSPNLMVGIRGTSGVIGQDEKGRPILYLTDGEVEITGVNPDTGETKTIRVKAPVKVAAHYYNDRPQGQTLEFSEVPLEPDMLPAFAAEHIYENEELMQKITEDTGWTVTDFKDIHEDIVNNNYDPKPSDAFELGVMDADDIDKSLGLGLEEEPPAESEKQEEEPETEEPKAEEPAVEEPATDDTAQAEPINYAELARHDEKVLAAIDHFDESGKIILSDGTVFDPAYYAANNPDVVKAYGDDPYALLYHYLNHAKDKEDRYANQEEQNTAAAKKVEEQLAAEQWQKEQDNANKGGGEDEGGDTTSSESAQNSTPQVFTYTIRYYIDHNYTIEQESERQSGTASAGETVPFTAAQGYVAPRGEPDTVVVNRVGAPENRQYSFTMPSSDVTIKLYMAQ